MTDKQIKDLTTCAITNGPRGLQLDLTIQQDLDGEDWQFLGFSFDLNELFSALSLIDTEEHIWITEDKGKTWVKTEESLFV